MANPKGPPAEYRFKKGQSGNPGGRPKIPDSLKGIKDLDDAEMKRLISKYLRMTHELVNKIKDAMDIPMIEKVLARTMINASNHGDITKLLPLIERLCGKVMPQPLDAGGAVHKLTIERISGEKVEMTSSSAKEE
jgi:hypothetical protein